MHAPTPHVSLRRPGRKYLTTSERARFLDAAIHFSAETQLFCLVLVWSGARISEVLALTAASVDFEEGVAEFETLKRRKRGHMRQVPLPGPVLATLDRTFAIRERQHDPRRFNHRLWPWSRTTAWRRVRAVMARAGLAGLPATPKGLRHTFGVAAFRASVPPHLVQRWLGHASLRTTATYGDVVGPEELAFARRLWTVE